MPFAADGRAYGGEPSQVRNPDTSGLPRLRVVEVSPVGQARRNAGRVAAFLAVLAITAAAGWQAGRILEPPLPVPAATHGHDGSAP